MIQADKAVNFGRVTVSTGYNAGATAIDLETGDGAKLSFPMDVTWWDASKYATPGADPNKEIVSITNIVGDTLTVERGAQGTTASTKNTAGSTYKMVAGPTAKNVPIEKIKSADGVAVNNSIVKVADADLTFDIGANEVWRFEIGIFWYSATANIDLDLSGPAAPTFVKYGITGFGPAAGTCSSAFSAGNINDFNSGDADGQNTLMHGTVKNGANAGTVALRMAQHAAVAEDTKILKGSWLKAWRVA